MQHWGGREPSDRRIDACIPSYRTPISCALKWHHFAVIIIPICVISTKLNWKILFFTCILLFYFWAIKRLYLVPQFLFPRICSLKYSIIQLSTHLHVRGATCRRERLSQRCENRALKTLDPIPAPNFGTLKDTRTRGINRSTDRAIRIGDTKSRGSPSNW